VDQSIDLVLLIPIFLPFVYFQSNADAATVDENSIKIDALGLMFIIFFIIILIIQFIGMLVHRWGTFLHLLAITEIPNPFSKPLEDYDKAIGVKDSADKVLEFCDKLLSEPIPDYPDDNEDVLKQEQNTTNALVKEALKNLSEIGVRDTIGATRGNIGATMRETRGGLGLSIRNTNVNLKQSYTSQLRRSEVRRTFGDRDFRQSVGHFLLQSKRTPANQFDDPDENRTGVNRRAYRRNMPKPGGVQLGATLLNNVAEEAPRRFGSQMPFQKNLLKRVKDRNLDQKVKGLTRRMTEGGAANGGNLGRSFMRPGHCSKCCTIVIFYYLVL